MRKSVAIRVEVGQPNLVVQARDSYVYSQKKGGAEGAGGRQPVEPDSPQQRLSGSR